MKIAEIEKWVISALTQLERPLQEVTLIESQYKVKETNSGLEVELSP